MSAYGKLCTEFYDLDKPTAPAEALAFVLEQARTYGEPILEPMCGSGRYLLPLAQAGFDIDGVDNSQQMLAACKRRLAVAGAKAMLYDQSLDFITLPRRYRLAYIPDASICLLTDEEVLDEALRRIRSALLSDGVFVVGAVTPLARTMAEPAVTGSWVARPDGAKILLTTISRFDADSALLQSINRYELFSGHELLETEFEEFTLRLYEPGDFQTRLRQAGFTRIEAMKAHNGGAPSPDERFVLFRCGV
jgi:Methyltransferase domain